MILVVSLLFAHHDVLERFRQVQRSRPLFLFKSIINPESSGYISRLPPHIRYISTVGTCTFESSHAKLCRYRLEQLGDGDGLFGANGGIDLFTQVVLRLPAI
jgi:hypothetical protein